MYESYNVKSNPTSGDFNTNAETSFKGKNPLIINFQPVDNDDKANETTYIRYTPASLTDGIMVRALLTQN